MFIEGEKVRKVSDSAYAEADPPEDRNRPLEWRLGSHTIGFSTRNCRAIQSFNVHETEYVNDLSDMEQYAKGIEEEVAYVSCSIKQEQLRDYLAFLERDDSDPDIRVITTTKGRIDISIRGSEPVTDENQKLENAYIGSIGTKNFEPGDDGIWLDLRMPELQLQRLAQLIEKHPGVEVHFNVVIRGYTWEVDDAFREWDTPRDIIIADRFNYVVLKSVSVTTSEQSTVLTEGRDSSDDIIESDSGIDAALKEFIEEDLLKVGKDEKDWQVHHSQFNTIAQQVAESIARYSISRGENVSRFRSRLNDAYEILSSIRYATNKDTRSGRLEESEEEKAKREKAEHTIWYHGEVLFAFTEGYESEYAREVEADLLQKEVRKYLLRPWMENEQLEYLIVDALVFSTVNKFGEELKEHAPGPFSFLGSNMAYFSGKGHVMKMLLKRLQYRLTKLGIFFGAPIALGWYFWNRGRQDEVIIAGAAYGVILVLYLAYRLLRWVFGKKPQTLFEKYVELWPEMVATYDMLKADFISPTHVRDQLLNTTRRGAIWPGAIYAVLDHAIQRNPAVWGATESDQYRYNPFF